MSSRVRQNCHSQRQRLRPGFTLPSLSPQRLGPNPTNRPRVILSGSEGSAFLPYSCRIAVVFRTKKQILRRGIYPEQSRRAPHDIATQSSSREGFRTHLLNIVIHPNEIHL
jgi:hypothetical protein